MNKVVKIFFIYYCKKLEKNFENETISMLIFHETKYICINPIPKILNKMN